MSFDRSTFGRRGLLRVAGGLAAALAVGLAGAATTGCEAEVEPPAVGGYATVYADGVPPDIYAYPHVWYDGGYAYLVGDSWYYPRGRRWIRFRGEPPELHSYRLNYARPAPPVVRREPAPPIRGPVMRPEPAFPRPAPPRR